MHLNAIDRTKPQKLYYQILEILKEHIEKGKWGVGTQIPTEEQLCSQYNVSRATIRLAIAEMVSLGYLKKFQGKGTFVRRKKPGPSITMLVNFGEDSVYHNPSCITRIIESKIQQPDSTVRGYLNLSADDHCFFLSRLIIAEGTPLLMQKLYISYSVLPGSINADDLTDISLYSFLENSCGIKIQRIKEMDDVSHISEKDAGHLGLTSNLSALRARHICYAHDDTPISFSEFFYRTDTYARTLELERMRI